MNIRYVIANIEVSSEEERLYWNNSFGWVGESDAQIFTADDRRFGTLPIGGEWRPLLDKSAKTCGLTDEDRTTRGISRYKANEIIRHYRKHGTVKRHEGMFNCYICTSLFGAKIVIDTRWL